MKAVLRNSDGVGEIMGKMLRGTALTVACCFATSGCTWVEDKIQQRLLDEYTVTQVCPANTVAALGSKIEYKQVISDVVAGVMSFDVSTTGTPTASLDAEAAQIQADWSQLDDAISAVPSLASAVTAANTVEADLKSIGSDTDALKKTVLQSAKSALNTHQITTTNLVAEFNTVLTAVAKDGRIGVSTVSADAKKALADYATFKTVAESDINQAWTSGKITAAQEQTILADVQTLTNDLAKASAVALQAMQNFDTMMRGNWFQAPGAGGQQISADIQQVILQFETYETARLFTVGMKKAVLVVNGELDKISQPAWIAVQIAEFSLDPALAHSFATWIEEIETGKKDSTGTTNSNNNQQKLTASVAAKGAALGLNAAQVSAVKDDLQEGLLVAACQRLTDYSTESSDSARADSLLYPVYVSFVIAKWQATQPASTTQQGTIAQLSNNLQAIKAQVRQQLDSIAVKVKTRIANANQSPAIRRQNAEVQGASAVTQGQITAAHVIALPGIDVSRMASAVAQVPAMQ